MAMKQCLPMQQSSDGSSAKYLRSVFWTGGKEPLQRRALHYGCSLKPCFILVVSSICDSTALRHVGFFSSPSEASSPFSSGTLPNMPSHRTGESWVCYGGGQRPRKPRIWKTRQRRGSIAKSTKLLECIESLSNVKEEVYGALDAFIAWELDFPLIPVRKALHTLEIREDWPRVIQVCKWMLGKGQGRTLNTYLLLLKAFSKEGRIDEAQALWEKVFSKNLDCTPMSFFVEVMRMYERHGMENDIIEVFADMEELDLKLDNEIVNIVSDTYEKLGMCEKAEKVRLKYPFPAYRWRTVNGKIKKFPNSQNVSAATTNQGFRSDEEVEDAGILAESDGSEARESEDSENEESQVGIGVTKSTWAVGSIL